MTYQEQIIESTKKAADEFFRYARAVPSDKLTWQPLDAGRSALDLTRELARTPVWAYDIVSGAPAVDMTEESLAAEKAITEQWTTVEACEAESRKQLERYFELVQTFPNERLTETRWLPYEGGRDFPMSELLGYPLWNFTYHTGQLAYIQTLYGDHEMH